MNFRKLNCEDIVFLMIIIIIMIIVIIIIIIINKLQEIEWVECRFSIIIIIIIIWWTLGN